MDTIDLGSIMTVLLAVAAVMVSIVTFFISKKRAHIHESQLKDAREKQYAEYLRNAMSDLHDVYKTEDSIKSKNQCELFATRLLDILAILTNLSNTKKIDKDVLEFIQFDLDIAKSVMAWYDDKKLYEKYGVKNSEEIWSNLSKHFTNSDKDNTEDYDYLKLLPQKLKMYDTLPEYA